MLKSHRQLATFEQEHPLFQPPQKEPPLDWSTDNHLGLWLNCQFNTVPPKPMAHNHNYLPQSEYTVGNAGSEYTITTEIASDARQLQEEPYMGAHWPTMYNPQPVHPCWDQLYMTDFSGDIPLATPTPILNNGFSDRSIVTSGLNAYDGISNTGAQPSPAPSENILSPLFAPTPSTLPSPSSPSTPYDKSGSNDDSLYDTANVQNNSQADKTLYSHREQLVMFREALKLPMDGAGPFIPQYMYKPHTTSDRKRYVEEVLLEAPLFFYSDDPTRCGILLKDALHSRTRKLRNREKPVFEGRGPSVSIRLEWPGYRQWSKQIPTKDFRNPPCPITMAKLAKNVAKCVQRFIQERKSTPMEEDSDFRWRIGDGPQDIKLEDLVLVSMHHVSLGSWQPQLRLVHPRVPTFARSTTTPTSTAESNIASTPSLPLSQHAQTSRSALLE